MIKEDDDEVLEYTSVCQKLDELTMQKLDFLEEQLILSTKLENIMKTGFIEMAKSRYIIGDKAISTTQLPSQESNVEPQAYVSYDSLNKMSLIRNKDKKDPLNWFGILVPGSLKQSQLAFQQALELVVDLVNIRNQWFKAIKDVQELSKLKKTVLPES